MTMTGMLEDKKTIGQRELVVMVALLMSQFGPRIKAIIDNNFNLVAGIGIVALVGGFVAFRYMF